MNIPEMIKLIRIRKGLTQKELAKILGCHYQQLQLWEYGKYIPSGKYLIKLIELSKE